MQLFTAKKWIPGIDPSYSRLPSQAIYWAIFPTAENVLRFFPDLEAMVKGKCHSGKSELLPKVGGLIPARVAVKNLKSRFQVIVSWGSLDTEYNPEDRSGCELIMFISNKVSAWYFTDLKHSLSLACPPLLIPRPSSGFLLLERDEN